MSNGYRLSLTTSDSTNWPLAKWKSTIIVDNLKIVDNPKIEDKFRYDQNEDNQKNADEPKKEDGLNI